MQLALIAGDTHCRDQLFSLLSPQAIENIEALLKSPSVNPATLKHIKDVLKNTTMTDVPDIELPTAALYNLAINATEFASPDANST